MTKQTIAEQLAREDIEALDDNDKKLKELLCESRDQEITNLTKGMTKPNRPQLSEEMNKKINRQEALHRVIKKFLETFEYCECACGRN